MTTRAKLKIGKRWRWAILPSLILFVVVWYDRGIGPSNGTLALRRQLAGTTSVKVFYFTEKQLMSPYPYKIKPKTFTLQGQEASDFAHSILIRNRFFIFDNVITSTVYNPNRTYCEFYRGSTLIASLYFRKFGSEPRISGTTIESYRQLCYASSRHIYRIFEEHAGDAAK